MTTAAAAVAIFLKSSLGTTGLIETEEEEEEEEEPGPGPEESEGNACIERVSIAFAGAPVGAEKTFFVCDIG